MSGVEIIAVNTPARDGPLHRAAGAAPRRRPELRRRRLLLERRRRSRPRRTRTSQHAEAQFWLARRDGRDVGRISAQIDQLAAGPRDRPLRPDRRRGRPEVFEALFAAAEAWLKRGKQRVLGPFNLSDQRGDGPAGRRLRHAADVLMGHDPRTPARASRPWATPRRRTYRLPRRHRATSLPTAAQRFIAKRTPGVTVRKLDMQRYARSSTPHRDLQRRLVATTGASCPSPRPRSRTWPRA